jgi:LysR family nitrogen assimilation transcriptional regulator
MDIRELEFFIKVAELGSLTKAAVALDISQPSLSRQVHLLESELNSPLFYRTGRGVRLTPAGAVFLEHASAIIEAAKRAQSAVSEFSAGAAGRIAIGIPPRIARVLTPPLIETFRRMVPRASINVAEGLSATLGEWLNIGRIEMALLFNPPNSLHLDLEPLCREELVLVGCESHHALPKVVKFAELVHYPLILPPIPNAIRATVESGCRHAQVQLKIVIEVDTVQAILDLILRKQGFGIVPRGAVPSKQSRFCVARIERPHMTHTVMLATSRRQPVTQLRTKTCQLIRDLNLPGLLGGYPITTNKNFHMRQKTRNR